jgi:alpha-mannosidase
MRPTPAIGLSVACFYACFASVTAPLATAVVAADFRTVWSIGKPDGANAEFALAPSGYSKFQTDGFFVVGRSKPSLDWPYAHPGPSDSWAGGGTHTFSVVFGLSRAPSHGECRLQVALLDTHAGGPPKLEVRVNGRTFERALAAGAGDASIHGDLAQGKPQRVEFAFPASLLVCGDNHVQLCTTSGSWMLYDSVWLESTEPLGIAPAQSSTVVEVLQPVRALRREGQRLVQPLRIKVRHYGEPMNVTIEVEGVPPKSMTLAEMVTETEVWLPAVKKAVDRAVRITAGDKVLATRQVSIKPVRPLTVYILPHSHTDIGYTEIQTAIEDKQVENLRKGIEYARRTASYPEGARFVWNVEVLWAADLYLRRRPEAERQAFFDAVKKGQVVLNGMYLNELTGLCRTEELLRLFRYSTELGQETGVPIDSVMISDVPGYTWGTVTAMSQAGLRYFSTAPNYFDRIGDILQKWENKPFWWIGPSGKERILVWIPFKGYAMSHVYRAMSPSFVNEYQEQLEKMKYPFDIAYMRWSGHGDNAEPDPAICDFVRDWNMQYAWPRFVISGTGEAFRAFEKRYGKDLPTVRGDWTPYWEDGAGSSALETAMNRQSSDRVTQAEALFALRDPKSYPAAEVREAWNQVLLYSEHTWGAWCSVSDPEAQATKEQWAIKRSYALEADRRSRDLLERVAPRSNPSGTVSELDVFNSTSWSRTELVRVDRSLRLPGDRVLDPQGNPVPSQRLSDGSLVFLVTDAPPLAGQRYRLVAGEPFVGARNRLEGAILENDGVRVQVDPRSGAIKELTSRGTEGNFADAWGGEGLNEYLFLPGDQVSQIQRNDVVTLRAGESGPLVSSLVAESAAPGCRRLVREIRLVAGLDHVELINLVDKERAATPNKPNDGQFAQKGGKESVNFAFPFQVPDGQLRLELPMGVIQPDIDQMPSACKNWFTIGRWADVSNRRQGIEWVALDAPLVQVGGITATLVGSQSNPDVWRKQVGATRRIYSWAMNNHWGTNYRAYQEGPVTFRFLLRPHGPYDAAANSRFAISASQPLVAIPASATPPNSQPRLHIEPAEVLVTGLKPTDDGAGLVVRLYGGSEKASKAKLHWTGPEPVAVFLSDTSEVAREKIRGTVTVPGHGIVTLRVEFKDASMAQK